MAADKTFDFLFGQLSGLFSAIPMSVVLFKVFLFDSQQKKKQITALIQCKFLFPS